MEFLISETFNENYGDHTKSIMCAAVKDWFNEYPYEIFKIDDFSLKAKGHNFKDGTYQTDWIDIHEHKFPVLGHGIIIYISPVTAQKCEAIIDIL